MKSPFDHFLTTNTHAHTQTHTHTHAHTHVHKHAHTHTHTHTHTLTHTHTECPGPECGAGIFMAAHFDRQYCGKCGLTYVYKKSDDDK